MSTIPAAPSASIRLRGLAALGLAGVAIGAVNLATGLGLPCPFRAATGWLCPFCGGTHMMVALLRGDLTGAWAANPLVLILGAVALVRGVGWLVEWVRDPHATASRRWVPYAVTRHWGWLAVAVGVLYVLARNLF